MVEFRQGFRSMAALTRELEKLIVSPKLADGGNPVTRWMATNVAVAQDPAGNLRELGVKPECEVFDTGHLWFVNELMKEGLIADPPLIQLCHGIPYGAPADFLTAQAKVVRETAHLAVQDASCTVPAARCWAARPRSTAWSTCAVIPAISTNGRRMVLRVGAIATACRIFAR